MRAAVVRGPVAKLRHWEDTWRNLRCHSDLNVCTPGSRHPNELGLLLFNDEFTNFSFCD